MLSTLFQFFSCHAPHEQLQLVWQVMWNLVRHAAHVTEIVERLADADRIVVMAECVDWHAHESNALAVAMTWTLRTSAENNAAVHPMLLKYVAVMQTLMGHGPWDASHVDAAPLENCTVTLALVVGACARDYDRFCQVLIVIERLVELCAFRMKRAQDGAVCQGHATGFSRAIERLLCALCDLLLSFQEDETNNSMFPGYDIKPIFRNPEAMTPLPPTASPFSRHQSRVHPPPLPKQHKPLLSVRPKRTGVYSRGYSPPESETLDRILRIFTVACSMPTGARHDSRRQRSKHRSLGNSQASDSSACGQCLLYVSDFFFHVSHSQSGRTLYLNPSVVHFWNQMRPRMEPYSLQLCYSLTTCLLSKHHTFSFLTSGALRLYVHATCQIVRVATSSRRNSREVLVEEALLQVTICAAILSEQAPFLQFTYYLVHAGGRDHITVAGMFVAVILHGTKRRGSGLVLASKVLSRLLSLFTMKEAEEFLAACPTQLSRALGWYHVTANEVAMALVTMLEHTESEAIMKQRVLVKVLHSALLRTAVLGLIDKRIPEILQDFGIKSIMNQMQTVLATCRGVREATSLSTSGAIDSSTAHEKADNRRPSIASNQISDKWVAGLLLVGEAAKAGVQFIGNALQVDADDHEASGDASARRSRRVEQCVSALKAITSEIAVYATKGYQEVYDYFESKNDDLELIATLHNSTHAIAFTQAAFYGLRMLEEALVATDHEETTATPSKVAEEFVTTLEQVFNLIVASLQHNDVDVLFFSHKIQQLGSFLDAKLQLPGEDRLNGSSHNLLTVETEAEQPNDPTAGASIQRLGKRRTRGSYPVFLRFRSLVLRSWLWPVLGFMPYLRVTHRAESQLIQFAKSDAPHTDETPDDSTREYKCAFLAVDAEADRVETFYRELPHIVDVEVWIYLPFWYRDVLVSRAKVPLLAPYMEKPLFSFHFYPDNARGARAFEARVIGTLTMELSDRRGPAAVERNTEFPAYSTLGSKRFRQFAVKAFDTAAAFISTVWRAVGRVTHLDEVSRWRQRHIAAATAPVKDSQDSVENDRRDEGVGLTQAVGHFVGKIVSVLREATHPDKLIVLATANECSSLISRLEELVPAFTRCIADAFETKYARVWLQLRDAFDSVYHVFLAPGLTLFTAHLQQQQPTSETWEQTGEAVETRGARHEKRPSKLVHSTERTAARSVFRDVTSQLRYVHFHEDLTHLFTGGARELLRLSTTSSRLYASAKLLQSLRRRSSNRQHDPYEEGAAVASKRVTDPWLFHDVTSKSKSRLLSPHVSLWTLSRNRVPDWHSFSRMTAPTSLTQFLLQPLERLQVSRPPPDRLHECDLRHCSLFSSLSTQTTGLLSIIRRRAPRDQVSASQRLSIQLSRVRAFWRHATSLSGRTNRLAMVQKALASAPEVEDFEQLEATRAKLLIRFSGLDPFDASARLLHLYSDAKNIPCRLYREGLLASVVHASLWVVLALTVWRVSVARDAVRDSERSFYELLSSQLGVENTFTKRVARDRRRSWSRVVELASLPRDRSPRIVISDQPQNDFHGHLLQMKVPVARHHQVAPHGEARPETHAQSNRSKIALTQKEHKHLITLLELKHLLSDILRVWPAENGNIGLNGFWSSIAFTVVAVGSPFLFLYVVFPWLLSQSPANVESLSNIVCAYGAFWILLAFVSILGVTRKIPAFREVRRVERIDLTTWPYCVRNYMAIGSVLWDSFQLNTTSFAVWKMSNKPKQLVALTTIDLQDLGLGSLQVNVFESKQVLALVCLIVWSLCLKASNKFKSMQYLNYLLTFLLPNLLGGMLFMFLSKQFYQAAACYKNSAGIVVMWANSDVECWTGGEHMTYALRGMFGMSAFVPLAVLAYGSYQVFFPEVNLDVQTSPMLHVSAQIVKAAMMGALTFFVDRVRLFLGVALVGNLLLLFLVTTYQLCSSWHLTYAKVLIYAMSSWSALCAMISTFVPDEDRDRLPLYTMHAGWSLQTLMCVLWIYRRMRSQRRQRQSDEKSPKRRVLIRHLTANKENATEMASRTITGIQLGQVAPTSPSWTPVLPVDQ